MNSCPSQVPQFSEQLRRVFERRPSSRTLRECCLVALTITIAVVFRTAYLDEVPFWVDEAESSINALTILQHGYPTDTYLGLPIYENILAQPWPENREYAFRDLSYSENHFAIYHGWLPLYAIAASFALQDIQPDKLDKIQTWTVKHDLNEQKRRTRAARLPGALFGMLFLLIAFIGGKLLYGSDAGWIALAIGSVHPWHVQLSRQARYYSAEVTLTTACCILLWLLIENCTWKRACAAAFAFILLFYTHLLSFFTAIVVFFLVIPWILKRQRGALPKIMVFGALTAAATLPWVIVTGFLKHQAHIPRAWSLLQFPADLVQYRPLAWPNLALGGLIVFVVGFVMLMRPRISSRLSGPIIRLAPVLLFLGIWGACAYASFLLFMPAASFATERLNLSYWGPLFLLESAICAAAARVIGPRISVFLGCLLMVFLLWSNGASLKFGPVSSDQHWATNEAIFRQIEAMRLKSDAKLFAAPNDDLIFTFYSGLPVQDITPVRKSFLNSYRGDIVYIEPRISVYTGVLTPERVRDAALRSGLALSPAEAEQWSTLLSTRDTRVDMLRMLAPDMEPKLEALPSFARQLLELQRSRVSSLFSTFDYAFLIRGFQIRTWSDWRTVIRYRFVDPLAHWGVHANYVERFRGAEVTILPEIDTVMYRSKWHPPCQVKRAADTSHITVAKM